MNLKLGFPRIHPKLEATKTPLAGKENVSTSKRITIIKQHCEHQKCIFLWFSKLTLSKTLRTSDPKIRQAQLSLTHNVPFVSVQIA